MKIEIIVLYGDACNLNLESILLSSPSTKNQPGSGCADTKSMALLRLFMELPAMPILKEHELS
jgi:hypothetical protein